MDVNGRLAELRNKHSQLEKKIDRYLTQPSADSLEITELKREKLYIKEQITRLLEMKHQAA